MTCLDGTLISYSKISSHPGRTQRAGIAPKLVGDEPKTDHYHGPCSGFGHRRSEFLKMEGRSVELCETGQIGGAIPGAKVDDDKGLQWGRLETMTQRYSDSSEKTIFFML